MSAVLQEQASLEGLEPVQTPEPLLPMLAVNGIQRGAAMVRSHHPSGAITVEIVLEQRVPHHPRALPILLRHEVRDAGSFDATYRLARELSDSLLAGGDVMAVGRGIEPRKYLGEDVLALLHVDSIGPCPVTDPKAA